MNADRGNFRRKIGLGPGASQAFETFCRNSKIAAGPNQNLFKSANKIDRSQRFSCRSSGAGFLVRLLLRTNVTT